MNVDRARLVVLWRETDGRCAHLPMMDARRSTRVQQYTTNGESNECDLLDMSCDK